MLYCCQWNEVEGWDWTFFIICIDSHCLMHKWLIPSGNQRNSYQLNQSLLRLGTRVWSAAVPLMSWCAFGLRSILQKINEDTKDKCGLAVFLLHSRQKSGLICVSHERWHTQSAQVTKGGHFSQVFYNKSRTDKSCGIATFLLLGVNQHLQQLRHEWAEKTLWAEVPLTFWANSLWGFSPLCSTREGYAVLC